MKTNAIIFLLVGISCSCLADFAITKDISVEDFKSNYLRSLEIMEKKGDISFLDINFFDIYGNSKSLINARRGNDGNFEVEAFIVVFYSDKFVSDRNQYQASLKHNFKFDETLATAKFEISKKSQNLFLDADQKSKFSTFITIGSKNGGKEMNDIFYVEKIIYSHVSFKKLLKIIESIAKNDLDTNGIKMLSVFPH